MFTQARIRSTQLNFWSQSRTKIRATANEYVQQDSSDRKVLLLECVAILTSLVQQHIFIKSQPAIL